MIHFVIKTPSLFQILICGGPLSLIQTSGVGLSCLKPKLHLHFSKLNHVVFVPKPNLCVM